MHLKFVYGAIVALFISIFASGCITTSSTQCDNTYSPVCGVDDVTYDNACKAVAAGTRVKHEGKCMFCSESDKGKNLMERGTVVFDDNTYTDSCFDGKVREYYCENEKLQTSLEQCPQGYVCENGVCVLISCVDSDNGISSFSRGIVTKGDEIKEDRCLDSARAVKYYCESNNIKETVVFCQAGYVCSDGRCIERCTTTSNLTDAPYNIYKKDTVSIGDISKTDTCINSQKVLDYYCTSNGFIDSQVTICPLGFYCEDGACKSSSCQDSDGKDIYTAGKAFVRGMEYADSCVSASEVKEYYCEGLQLQIFTRKCPSGYTCSGGACVDFSSTCYDTEVGQDIYVRGEVTYQFPTGYFTTYKDECIDRIRVKDYYCRKDGTLDYIIKQCPVGYECSWGVCIRENGGDTQQYNCYETDNGNNPGVYGVLSYGNKKYSDVCNSFELLTEYYCNSPYSFTYQTYTVGTSQECWNGKIWNDIYCIDPDEGESDIFKRSTVTRGHQAYTDECDGLYVKEYYCTSLNQIAYNLVKCEKGCANGACIVRIDNPPYIPHNIPFN